MYPCLSMIYGRLTLSDDWRTAQVQGDTPESFYQNDEIRIFFWGIVYNRDILLTGSSDKHLSNAALVAGLFKNGGVTAFAQLDGCFTIVYFSSHMCGVTRDAHGTHWPVYYQEDGTFSTSLHSFWSRETSCALDRCSLSSALQRGLMLPRRSALQGISRLEAGYSLILSVGKIFVRNVYELGFSVQSCSSKESLDTYADEYGRLHESAIRRRIGTVDRVGILLSGGYDSGSNLAALRKVYSGAVDSYSIGFKGDDWSELPLTRIMSQEFGTNHHEYEIDGNEIRFLPDIVRFLGEPFVEGGLMVNYCAMRLVDEDKPPVILGGDGNDQYFGTSGREVALYYLASRMGILPLLRGLYKCLEGERMDKGDKFSRIRFHVDKILHLLEGERFGFTDAAMRWLLQRPDVDFSTLPAPVADVNSFDALYNQHTKLSDMDIVIDRIILYKASVMARMFGNHLVYPFMDRGLYVFLQRLPVSLKCKSDSLWAMARGHSVSKYLLKYHYKLMLPVAITSRRKQGGFAPMPLFFADDVWRARLKDFILSSSIMDDYLNRTSVRNFLDCYDVQSGKCDTWFWYRQNQALQYFNLLTMAVWWEEFVAGKRVDF